MKKVLYIAVLAVVAVFISACQKEEDPFGGKLPSERMEAAINKMDSALLSAPYGWEMQYFAQPNTAGYPLLVKFGENSSVMVAGQNRNTMREYKVATSYYDIREGNGAMLSFETYNDVLHAFSLPENPAGKGQEGDYEFYMDANGYSQSGDTLILTGKKRGTKIMMVKLTQEWEDWSKYFETLSAVTDLTFANNAGSIYSLRLGGAGPTVTYNEYVFTSDDANYGFILTPTRLRLYNGFTRNEQTAYNFVLDNPKNPTKFVCVDEGVEATIEPRYNPLAIFKNAAESSSVIWGIELNTMGSTLNGVMSQIKANLANTGATLVVADMLYVADAKSPALRFRYRVDGREFEGRVFFTYTFTPRTNPNTVTLTYKGVEQDGTSFLKRVGNGDEQVGLSLIKSMFEHKYGVTCSMGGTFNPSSMLFTSTEDANLTFIVTKRTY